MIKSEVKFKILRDVCTDCIDLIDKVDINCGKCPVHQLIRRTREYKFSHTKLP